MPKGPKGEKRPADVIGAAVKVMKIATGEETDNTVTPTKRSAGGKARAKALSAAQKADIARLAAEARWKKGGN